MRQIIAARVFSHLNIVIVGDEYGELHIFKWDGTFHYIKSKKTNTQLITSIDMSFDGKYIVITGAESSVYVYLWQNMTLIGIFTSDIDIILQAKFIYGTHRFIYLSKDAVMCTDVNNFKTEKLLTTSNLDQGNIDIHKNGQEILISRMWGEIEYIVIGGNQETIYNTMQPSSKALFCNNNKLLGLCAGNITIIDKNNINASINLPIKEYINDFKFSSPNCNILAISNKNMYIWDTGENRLQNRLKLNSDSNELIDVSENNILITQTHNMIEMYDFKSLKLIATLNIDTLT